MVEGVWLSVMIVSGRKAGVAILVRDGDFQLRTDPSTTIYESAYGYQDGVDDVMVE